MQYEGTLYRPPSEARSLIIQVTIGCAHNRCTFCNMYREKKFRVREKEEIMRDLDECRAYYGPMVRRVFFRFCKSAVNISLSSVCRRFDRAGRGGRGRGFTSLVYTSPSPSSTGK